MALLSTFNKLTISMILDQISFFIGTVVLFPLFTSLGASQLYIGSTMSIMSLIGLIWNPIIGSLGDSYGRRFILMRLLILNSIATLLMLSNSLKIIFLARMLTGFCWPLLPIMNSLASEILVKEEQESHFARIPVLMAFNMIGGSAIGGFISGLNNGTFLCFTLIVIISLINAGVISTLPEDKKNEQKEKESLPLLQVAQKELRAVVTKLTNVNWNVYSEIFTAKLCMELSCAIFYQTIAPSYLEYGFEGGATGYVLTLMSVNTIVTSMVLAELKKSTYSGDKFGRKRLFHAAALLLAAAVIMTFSGSVITFSIGVMFMSIARTIADSTFTEALMAKATDEDRGGVSGAFESIASFSGLVTPVCAGILTDLYGIKFILTISIIPATIGILLNYREYKNEKKDI
ncbi:hypothetical protein WA026_019021 [Henosepilachna vigintioctopunctata]|uniref:Major facilitator superfamily (MFS) profile domain-containing protein n=1 Tax=Henosepilachna vigintioctopunctata TaxID=420089 RepID=A0AAW1VHF4_9CUCU